jgi:hypothetical protein
VDVAPAAAESAEVVVVPVAVVPPSEPLDWSDMMAKCRRLFEKTSREVGAQMDCLTAHATVSDGKVAQLETELEVARDDLQKMKEIVASNEMQRQGLEKRMSDLEDHIFSIVTSFGRASPACTS